MSPSELNKALSKGKKIGSLVWYDCRNASITPSRLNAMFVKHSMKRELDNMGKETGEFVDFPDDIKPKNAFQKACRLAMAKQNTDNTVSNKNASDTRKSVSKMIVDGLDRIVYGVVDLDVHQTNESIDPDFSAKVWLDKNNLTIGFDNKHPMVDHIVATYADLQKAYTTRDISRMVVNTLERMCAVSLRDAGVIYFVPVGFDNDLQALQSVVNNIGQCNMRVFTVGNDDGNANNVAETARSQIADKIAAMKKDIVDLKDSITSETIKGTTIENSISVRHRRYLELKTKCLVLADALQVTAESLTGDLDSVRKLIEDDLKKYTQAA